MIVRWEEGCSDRRVFVALYEKGVTVRSIAGALQITERSVGYLIQKFCLSRDKPKPRTALERKRVKTTLRPCLMCGEPFPSAGIYQRVCDGCKDTTRWRVGTI